MAIPNLGFIVGGSDYLDLAKVTEEVKKGNPLDTQVGGSHYKKYPIQPTVYNQRNQLNHCEACVVKYVTRHKDKGGKEDIKKAIHYLELLLEMEYNG